MFKEFKYSIGSGGSGGSDAFVIDQKIEDKISEKLDKCFEKNKNYVDRAVEQMQAAIKKYST